jgi:hypothetical protein
MLTAPELAVPIQISAVAKAYYPNLKRFGTAANEAEARDFNALGMTVIIERVRYPVQILPPRFSLNPVMRTPKLKSGGSSKKKETPKDRRLRLPPHRQSPNRRQEEQ